MPHSAECLRQQEQAKLAKEAYEKAWTKYCHFCNAEGGYRGTENMGQPYFDPCPVCLEHGRCPRCAELSFVGEANESTPETCKQCGWDENKPGALPVIQCTCDPDFPLALPLG